MKAGAPWLDEKESLLVGLRNRLLQLLARNAPGATTVRVWLHRRRGVRIGRGVWIGYDAVIETSRPRLIRIGDRASIGIGALIIGHYREKKGVAMEEDASVGPGAVVLPGVRIGRGAVITAGSVVTRNVRPMTVVRGNPAVEVARLAAVATPDTSLREFSRSLRPLAEPDEA